MEGMRSGEVVVKVLDKTYPANEDIKRLICYIWRMEDGAPWSGQSVYPLTVEGVYNAFLSVQNWFRKLDGRRVMHVIISFPAKGDINMVQEKAESIARSIGTAYQCIWGIHTDTNNLHIHLGINAVSYLEGRKITKERFMEYIAGKV